MLGSDRLRTLRTLRTLLVHVRMKALRQGAALCVPILVIYRESAGSSIGCKYWHSPRKSASIWAHLLCVAGSLACRCLRRFLLVSFQCRLPGALLFIGFVHSQFGWAWSLRGCAGDGNFLLFFRLMTGHVVGCCSRRNAGYDFKKMLAAPSSV